MSFSHQATAMQQRLDQSNCNLQNHQSLLIGSPQICVGPEAGNILCILCEPLFSKHYARQGDLTRHIKTVHGAPSRYLCHIHQCPRSISGQGFGRKDKLVDHLKSSKPGHRLTHQDAVCQAAIYDMAYMNGLPHATPLHASHQNAVQYPALLSNLHKDFIDEAPTQGTVYDNVVYNLPFHSAAIGNGVIQGFPNNNFDGLDVNQGVFDSTFYGNAIDQATFSNTYDAGEESQTTCNSALTVDIDDDLEDNIAQK